MRTEFGLLFTVTAAALLHGCARGQSRAAPLSRDVPIAVRTATVVRKDVPIDVSVVGTAEAFNTITVLPQVEGTLTRVYFHEGDSVKKGDRLFEIDPRPFEDALAQAQANLARDQAALKLAHANLGRDSITRGFAEEEAARNETLFHEGIDTGEQEGQFKTSAKTSEETVAADHAAIESSQALVDEDRAAIEAARNNLGYTTIVSPVDGVTGNLALKAGNLVVPNQTKLETVAQIQPIYADFDLSETILARLTRQAAHNRLPVTAATKEHAGAIEQGRLTFIDNNVDPSTGTIALKAQFPNASRAFWPGEFLRVTIHLDTRRDAVVVPADAVENGQHGKFVYIVGADHRISPRDVITGPQFEDEIVIEKGLNPGETVVVEKDEKNLAPGMLIEPQSPAA